MKFLNIISILILLLSILNNVDAAQQQITLDNLKNIILEAENKLANVRIDCEYIAETWDKNNNKWDFAGESIATGWFPNIPGSKFRIDYQKQVLPWEDGPAPFSEEKYIVTYNGRVTQTLHEKTGAQGNPIEEHRGTIRSERHNISAIGAMATGWEFSIYGYGDRYGKRFSELFFGENDRALSLLSLEKSKYVGRECLVLVVTSPISSATITSKHYFDISKNYTLRGYEYMDKNGEIQRRVSVEEIKEIAPGIYYPTKATKIQYIRGEPFVKSQYKGKNIIVNDPEFSDDIFSIKWPDGTYIYDHRSDVSFKVSPSEKTILGLIDSQLDSIKAIWIAISIFTVAIVIFLIRKTKIKTYIFLIPIIACFYTICYVQADVSSVTINELGDQKVYNCGLIAT